MKVKPLIKKTKAKKKGEHGGKREGAGRPFTGIVWKMQSVSWMPDQLEQVREAAALDGVSFAAWVRSACETKLKRQKRWIEDPVVRIRK